jgi:hypothetical protein
MKTNILASALVLTFLIGLTPAADAGGRFWGRSSRSGPAAAAAAAAAKAKARQAKVNQVNADLKTAIANDPSNAAKYSAAAVQILGIDTKTSAGRSELSQVQATARNAVSATDSFKGMTQAQRNTTLNKITIESRQAVGTAPTSPTIVTNNVAPTNPLNFPNTLEVSNPLISATLGLLADGTGAAGERVSTLFAGLGYPSGTNITTNPASDGTISIVVNPPVVTQGSPTPN